MAYYYNHRFLVTPVAGYEDRYQEFCKLMKACRKEKNGNKLFCQFFEDPDENHVYLRGFYGRNYGRKEIRYRPVITDDHCEFFMWTRYVSEYLAEEFVEDLAYTFSVSVYKVYGEEDRDDDGAGFVHVEFMGEELDEEGEWEYALFDHGLNFDESYQVKDASGHYVRGESLVDRDSVTYAQLTMMLRALAWKKPFKMPERGITSLAASNNMSQMVKVIEAIIREQVSKDQTASE